MHQDIKEGLTVIIPAYNEEGSVADVITQLLDILKTCEYEHEVIVIDDASVDSTAEIVQHLPVRLLRHEENRGYGAALKTGIRNARYDVICITDADGTYPNETIPELVRRIRENGFDMVVGARTGEEVKIPAVRKPAKWAIGQLANIVVGSPIPDVNSGLRAFYRSVALQFFRLFPDGFSFTTTITLAMLTNGYLVDYMPVNYFQRVGKSKIHPIKDTLNFVQLILRVGLYFAPIKIFTGLSLGFILLAIAWGFFSWLVLGKLADVSTMVIVMTGIQIAVIGLLAELINHRMPDYEGHE